MSKSQGDSGSFLFCYIGTFLFIGAAIVGGFCLMPDLQQAMSMRDKPDTMSLAEFIQRGPGTNAYVRLTDLDVDLENSYEIIQTRRSRRGARRTTSSGIIANLYPSNRSEDTQSVVSMRAPESHDAAWTIAVENGVVEGRLVPKMTLDVADGMKSHINLHNTSSVKWTIEPFKNRPTLHQTRLNLIYALIIGALGLAIANVGNSTEYTVASFVSYFGAPLRRRPVEMQWCILYAIVGVVLIGGGFEMAFKYGKLGEIYFVSLMQTAGFIVAQIGLGAVCTAIVVPGAYALFGDSKSSRKPNSIGNPISDSQGVISVRPLERSPYVPSQFAIPQYCDPIVARIDEVPADDSVAMPASSLPGDFLGDRVACLHVREVSGETYCQVFLGSGGLFMTEQIAKGGAVEIRICTLLRDGMTLVTTHIGTTIIERDRQGTTALVQIVPVELGDVNLMVKLFESHLSKCEHLAIVRRTQVEYLQEVDVADAWQYARRAIAELQFQYGVSEFEVQPAIIGRFQYPSGTSLSPPPLPPLPCKDIKAVDYAN